MEQRKHIWSFYKNLKSSEMIKSFNIHNHDREIDRFFYDHMFATNQSSIKESVKIKVIITMKIGCSPNYEISLSEMSELQEKFCSHANEVDLLKSYICNYYKSAASNESYDVGLIVKMPNEINVSKLSNWLLDNVLKNEYSEFLQHDKEVNYGILTSDKSIGLFYSVYSDSKMNYFIKVQELSISTHIQ